MLDTVAPRVLIDSPAPGSLTTAATLTVTGRVNDVVMGTINSGQASVAVNGVTAEVSNRTFVAREISLEPGENSITATASDAVGNSDSKSIVVYRESLPGSRLSIVSGNEQTAGIGEPAPAALVVAVTDAGGVPIPAQTVVFRVAASNGYLTDAEGGRARGLAVSDRQSGPCPGPLHARDASRGGQRPVDATSPGSPGVATFTAAAVAHPAAKISLDSGNLQYGLVGQPLPSPFVAVVTDEGHNRLAGVPVTFSVAAGEGDLAGEASRTVTTDSDGRAVAVLPWARDRAPTATSSAPP